MIFKFHTIKYIKFFYLYILKTNYPHEIEKSQKYIKVDRISCVATFSIILMRLNPEQLELCVLGICRNAINKSLVVEENNEKIKYELREISIDGKAIRSTNNHGDPEKVL